MKRGPLKEGLPPKAKLGGLCSSLVEVVRLCERNGTYQRTCRWSPLRWETRRAAATGRDKDGAKTHLKTRQISSRDPQAKLHVRTYTRESGLHHCSFMHLLFVTRIARRQGGGDTREMGTHLAAQEPDAAAIGPLLLTLTSKTGHTSKDKKLRR